MKKKHSDKEKLQHKIKKTVIQEIPTFKLKYYTHFDRPHTFSRYINAEDVGGSKKYVITKESLQKLNKHIEKLKNFLSAPDEIAKHAFYPFIGFDIIERRASTINRIKSYKSLVENLSGEEKIKCEERLKKLQMKGIEKIRPIRYSAHIDGYIYSYYADILSKKYEEKIISYDLENEVLAYRKLPPVVIKDKIYRPNNFTMASEIFQQIKKRQNNCYVLAFDISSFYDNIDHANLYKEWCHILDVEKLPADHLNIFKSLTRYCYVDLREICLYSNKHKKNKCSKVSCENCNKKIFKKIPRFIFKNANDFRNFRKWYKSFYKNTPCEKFHKNPGIDSEKPFGIPQGTAISALLSNIYMLPFDIALKKVADSIGGIYRRYCDDILIICPHDEIIKENIIKFIMDEIKKRGSSLFIHPIDHWDKYSKSQCYDFTDVDQIKRQPLQYLGFYYDGNQVRIRESSLARYMRKSKRAVIATKLNAIKKMKNMHKKGIKLEDKHKKLYRHTLLERYTYKGKHNFINYAYKVFEVFDDSIIKKQVRNHSNRLMKLIKEADNEILSTYKKLTKAE